MKSRVKEIADSRTFTFVYERVFNEYQVLAKRGLFICTSLCKIKDFLGRRKVGYGCFLIDGGCYLQENA